MLRIEKKPPMVQVGVRIPPDVKDKISNLAKELSDSTITVTEGDVLRQIITDFFRHQSTQKVNDEGRQ